MSNPTGIIQSLSADEHGRRAVVSVDVSASCPRCAAGRGCGAGLMGGGSKRRKVEAAVDADASWVPGDEVQLVLEPQRLLAATAIVYGWPLCGALLAAGAAYLLQFGDAVAAVGAIGGLIAGLLAARRRLRGGCLLQFVPRVVGNAAPAGPGT